MDGGSVPRCADVDWSFRNDAESPFRSRPPQVAMGEMSRRSRLSFIGDESPPRSRLPALSLLAGRFESVAQRPLCRLADLFNPFENVFALPFVNRHPEGLPAVRGLDDRNCQITADVGLRFWFLRRFQDLEKLLGVSGRLEARKKQVYVGFIGEEHPARVLILQSGFKGMEAGSLNLERIRHELVLVQGVSHLWVGKISEDAVLDRDFDHLPLPIVAASAGDARSVFLDSHLQPKDDCGLVLIEHGHAPPTVDDG